MILCFITSAFGLGPFLCMFVLYLIANLPEVDMEEEISVAAAVPDVECSLPDTGSFSLISLGSSHMLHSYK